MISKAWIYYMHWYSFLTTDFVRNVYESAHREINIDVFYSLHISAYFEEKNNNIIAFISTIITQKNSCFMEYFIS